MSYILPLQKLYSLASSADMSVYTAFSRIEDKPAANLYIIFSSSSLYQIPLSPHWAQWKNLFSSPSFHIILTCTVVKSSLTKTSKQKSSLNLHMYMLLWLIHIICMFISLQIRLWDKWYEFVLVVAYYFAEFIFALLKIHIQNRQKIWKYVTKDVYIILPNYLYVWLYVRRYFLQFMVFKKGLFCSSWLYTYIHTGMYLYISTVLYNPAK